ncbi:MAG: alpha/beta hydrolase [Pseudomonadota bacterium]
MPLVRLNISGSTLAARGAARKRLARAVDALPDGAPVIVLIHGYKFSPRLDEHDPHTHILSLDPRSCWKAVSWPRQLGLGAGRGPEPLCVALGWEARGSLWQAYTSAAAAGAGLAELINLVRIRRPGRPVHVLAHSLGARVALTALPHLRPGAMGRVVLLAAAEMRSRAASLLDTPAGRALEVLNVTSRENDLFDYMLEWLVAPHRWGDRALGQGLGQASAPTPRWLDLPIDHDGTRGALAALGLPIPPADRRICHWSVYLRPGVFDIYRAVLADGMPFDRLRAVLPAKPAPRWSRLVQPPALPLPFPRGETS